MSLQVLHVVNSVMENNVLVILLAVTVRCEVCKFACLMMGADVRKISAVILKNAFCINCIALMF
jgi:hypothetical protein